MTYSVGRSLADVNETGVKFDLQLGMSQHAEMVVMYKDNCVNCR